MSGVRKKHAARGVVWRAGRAWIAVALVGAVLLIVAACGGGSSGGSEAGEPGSSDEAAGGVLSADDLAQSADQPDSPAAGEGAQAAASADQNGGSAAQSSTEEIDPEDAFLAFAECLRGEGLDVADPDFSSGGRPGGILRGIDRQDPDVQAALETCGSLVENARPELSAQEQSERQDSLLALVACLRDQGLDVADPDFSGGQGGAGGILRGGDIDLDDPVVQDALEHCRDEVPGLGRGPGR